MGTLDYSKDRAFKDAESAFQYLMQAKYKTVFLYNSVSKTLASEIQKLYSLIREENSKIADMDNQWVATNPYYWTTLMDVWQSDVPKSASALLRILLEKSLCLQDITSQFLCNIAKNLVTQIKLVFQA